MLQILSTISDQSQAPWHRAVHVRPLTMDHVSLSTATAHRLLRQLTTRANALAKLRPEQFQSVTTYSSSARVGLTASQHDHPLLVLPPPDKLASQLHFAQSQYKSSLELGRRIYALGDAFKNIVVKANIQPDSISHLLPLTALCALAIGHSLQDWERPDDDEEHGDHQSDADGPSYADEMYDAIPSSYRPYVHTHTFAFVLAR